MGAQSPEAPTIYPQATKIWNREPGGVPKTYDSQAKFWWTNNKIVRGQKGDLGFEKCGSSFEDLVEAVNLRYIYVHALALFTLQLGWQGISNYLDV